MALLYNPYPDLIMRNGTLSGFVSLCDLGSELLMSYQRGGDSGETDPSVNQIVIRRSSNYIHFGGETVAVDLTPTYAVQGSNLTLLSDGTLLCNYNRTSGPPTVREGVFFVSSTDDGVTWGSATQVSCSFDTDAAEGGPIIELSDGTLVAPVYGTAGGALDAACVFSSDGGSTWGSEVLIADGSADSLNYTEPNILLLANGNLLCLIRETDNQNIHSSTSSDNGTTWGALAIAFAGNSAPRMTQLADGTVVEVGREGAAGDRIVVRTSADNGATWSSELVVTNDNHTAMYGDAVELTGNQVGIGYGIKWAEGDGSVHYKIMNSSDLP